MLYSISHNINCDSWLGGNPTLQDGDTPTWWSISNIICRAEDVFWFENRKLFRPVIKMFPIRVLWFSILMLYMPVVFESIWYMYLNQFPTHTAIFEQKINYMKIFNTLIYVHLTKVRRQNSVLWNYEDDIVTFPSF